MTLFLFSSGFFLVFFVSFFIHGDPLPANVKMGPVRDLRAQSADATSEQ